MVIEKLTTKCIEGMKVGSVYTIFNVTSDVLNSTRALISGYKSNVIMDGGEFDYTTDIDRQAKVLTITRTK